MNSSRVLSCAAVLAVVAGSLGIATTSASAGNRRPPTTTAPPTTTPATTSTTIPVTSPPVAPAPPTGFVITDRAADTFAVRMSPATQTGSAELLSGPTVGGPAIVLVADGGLVSFLRLVENADYVFRYRNGVPSGSSVVYSPWVTFNFHTPTYDSLRPSAPQNVRVVSSTATTVTVAWEAVATAVRYDYSVNGGASIQTGVCSGLYCVPSPLLSATIARPTVGTTVSFSVTASRAYTVLNCAYCFTDQELLNRFNNSLPATITVSN